MTVVRRPPVLGRRHQLEELEHVGETLAWATGMTAQWVVDRWLASPPHRAVMLRPGFRRVGIGIVFGTFVGHGNAGVVTADFAGR